MRVILIIALGKPLIKYKNHPALFIEYHCSFYQQQRTLLFITSYSIMTFIAEANQALECDRVCRAFPYS